jgi:hypothetical protein
MSWHRTIPAAVNVPAESGRCSVILLRAARDAPMPAPPSLNGAGWTLTLNGLPAFTAIDKIPAVYAQINGRAARIIEAIYNTIIPTARTAYSPHQAFAGPSEHAEPTC